MAAPLLGIERANEILRFDYGKDGLRARGQPIALPPGIKGLPHNKGIECLVVPPRGLPLAGTLIAISERGLDSAGNIQGFPDRAVGRLIRRQAHRRVRRQRLRGDAARRPFDPGTAVFLDARASHPHPACPLARVAPRAVIDGQELIFADMGAQIDNFEGFSVHRAADGALVLTLISDDNFSPLQRTVLLQFTLPGE